MALGIYYGMFDVNADVVDSNHKLAIIRKPPPKAVRILYVRSIYWSMYQFSSHEVQQHMNTSGRHYADILNAFSLMNMFEYHLKSHWSLFRGVKMTKYHCWFKEWDGTKQAPSHCLN